MNLRKGLLKASCIAVISALALVGCGESSKALKDREGNDFKIPSKINTIISTAPSNTEELVKLGLKDKIIATDTYSKDIEGISSDLPKIDFRNPDVETIVSLKPDIIIASGHNKESKEDPLAAVKEAGIPVVYIPSSTSIQGIYDDLKFLGDVTNTEKKADEVIGDMKKEIDSIKKIGDTIEDKKKVYFEIGSTPTLFSFGKNTFLDEMIQIIGAQNILGKENSWVSPSEETILKENPDVILTNETNEDTIENIKKRNGFKDVKAVKESKIFQIDKNSSSRPSQNIIKALKEMAKAVYPDKYDQK